MSGGNIDTKVSTGLASCYSNIFKLAEVNGLKWMIYAGPSTSVSPGNDPVLMSYAELLSQGYACAWRKLLPPPSSKSGSVTDSSAAAAMVTGSNGATGDGEDIKDLWIFHFTDLPDLSAAVSSELRDKGAGSWDEGMNTEATGMFFRALRNLAERTLVGEDFLTLGKWFAQPDHSMSGEERGCVLYSFSYFIHAHRYVCATVDVQSAPKLYALTTSLLSEALASQDGLQVLLSPSGINAVLTGHSYGATEEGIKELLDEWKLFYPQRFATSSTSSSLPAAVEVVVAGARMKYPSQFLLVFYTGPSPPSSIINLFPNSKHVPQLWQDDLKFLEHQRNGSCNCKSMDVHRSSTTTKTVQQPSSAMPQSSTLKTELPPFHSGKQPHVDMSFQPKKDFPPPPPLTSTSSGYTPTSKHHKKHVPKYTTPFPSPTTSQPTSPLVDRKPPTHEQTLFSSTNNKQVKGQIYDLNKMAGSITSTNSSGNERRYKGRTGGWWNCLSLPPPSGHVPPANAPVNVFEQKVSLPTTSATPASDSPGISRRVPGNANKAGRTLSAGGDKSAKGRRNSSCESPRQPKAAKRTSLSGGGGGGNNRGRLSSMVDLGPAVLGSPLDTETFTPGCLASNFFSMTTTGSISDFLSADPSMASMSPNVARKNGGAKLCTVESEHTQSGEHTIEKVDSFSAVPFASQQQQPSKSEAFKPTATDYRSVKALEVTDIDIDLEHIFDDEEDDQDPDKMAKPSDTNKGPTSAIIKPTSTTTVTIPGVMGPNPDYQMLARMFPTPPSVEYSHNPDEKPATYESQCAAEKMDTHSSELLGCVDKEDEYVPLSFTPISVSDLPSSKLYPIPDSCIYTPLPPAPSIENTSEVTVNNPPQTETNHFVFPPPPLPSRSQRRSNLTLPIVSAQSPRSSVTPLLSSPAVSRAQNRFYKHVSSCTNTPVDSPIIIDGYTPTAPINQKLTPLFPEVHGLLVSLVLLESSFNDGLTETASYVGMGQMHVFPGRQFRLDSVSTITDMNYPMEFTPSRTTSSSYYPGVDSSPLLASTAMDAITLGFQEDCPLAAEPQQQQQRPAGNTVMPDGSTSSGKFNSHLLSLENEEQGMLNEDCLSLLQDICIQCVFAGLERTSISSSLDCASTDSSSHHNDTLYSPQCLLSALRTARKLTQTKQARTLLNNFKQDSIELKKGDNSALWLKQLSSLSTKLLVRKLRELKPMFSLIFHHTSSFKSAPQGPLLLREFYQNTPGQGDDCFPMLMQPLMVGLDQDWVTVSPMAMFAWDKLMLEPFSLQKDMLYVVACHNNTTLINEAKKFFTELSITYDLCHLGKLWALVKNAGEGGIMPLASNNNSTDPYQAYCKKLLGPFLSTLPTDGNTLFGYTRRPSNEVYPQLSLTSTQQLELPAAIVIYFIMEDGYSELLKAFCTMLNEQAIPPVIKQRLHLQPVPRCCLKKDSHWNNSAWMKSLAFATFNQCRLSMESSNHTSSSSRITSVSSQRDLDKMEESIVGMSSLFTPVSILAPEKPLALSYLGGNTNKTDWVMNGETELLLCAYCVSHNQKWLLATFSDRSGELLSTAVIGIHPANSVSEFTCRFLALEKLWMHCISLISASVFKWTIIITRLGQPSSREISDWPVIINANDGLITANQLLTSQCEACKARSCKKPSLENFLLLSVQPELGIQLLATPETQSVSLSHVVVLPPDPSAVSSGSVTTPVAADFSTEDIMMFNPDDGAAGDMGGMDTDGLLNDLNEVVWNEDVIFPDDSQMPAMQGLDVNMPQASAYIFSVIPPGPLPEEFWGYKHHRCTQAAAADSDQSCSIFKVLYHYHLSMNPVPDSPQDTLSSVLACFDGLSWLNMDQIKGQRRSCLPLHLCVLSQLYRLIQSLSAKVR